MPVKYVPYGTVRVSNQWRTVLRAADKAGVEFHVTSGHRTMAEQWALYRQNMLRPGVPKPGRPLTAFPSPNAPHIRVGRPNHAIDVNSRDGGEQRLEAFLDRPGIDAENTVPGEPWHLELSRRELRRLYDRYKPKTAAPPRKMRRPVRELDLSPKGVDLIASFEGLRLKAYKAVPTERYWTIGYGHYGPDVQPGQTITKAAARALLRKDVGEAERAVRRTRVPMTQGEFDATVSFVFNLGPGVLDRDRTFGGYLRARKYWRAGASMLLYVNSGGKKLLGLVRRRRAERELFRS